MTIDPKKLRHNTLQTRDALSQDKINDASSAICTTLLNLPEIVNSTVIFAYVSFRSEVSTYGIIDALLAAGKTVAVPITRVKQKRLDAIRIHNLTTDLEPGYCNIPEPTEALCETSLIQPGEIDAILLPGSVFDKRGGRFGYGGGFYDRFVSSIPTAKRIGLAYDLQIVEQIPLQAHDELLDLVVTESNIYNGSR